MPKLDELHDEDGRASARRPATRHGLRVRFLVLSLLSRIVAGGHLPERMTD